MTTSEPFPYNGAVYNELELMTPIETIVFDLYLSPAPTRKSMRDTE